MEPIPSITSVRVHVPSTFPIDRLFHLEDLGGAVDIRIGADQWGDSAVYLSVGSLEAVEHAAITLANAATTLRRARREAPPKAVA